MHTQKVVIVTGANRGIGLAICERILAQQDPVKLYACSRAGKDLNFKQDASSTVVYPKLDITQSSQVQELASNIKSTDGQVDVLINNAGLNKSNPNFEDAEQIMRINYHGTLSMCQAFLPLMAKQGRIVNVSSTASSLSNYDKNLQDKFRNPGLILDDIDSLAKSYLSTFKSGKTSGWGSTPPYCASKACVNALTMLLARENPSLLVNCCCPGWVDTEMGNMVGKPPKSLAEGARIPVRLGVDDIEGVTGKYWGNPGVYDTGYGEVRPW